MKVLIVDSSVYINERLVEIVSEAKNIKAIYSASSYCQAIKYFNEYKPGTILLDVGLPRNESNKLLIEIKKVSKKSIVIMLSINMDNNFQNPWKLSGADFYLDKYLDFEKIPGIIDTLDFKKYN